MTRFVLASGCLCRFPDVSFAVLSEVRVDFELLVVMVVMGRAAVAKVHVMRG